MIDTTKEKLITLEQARHLSCFQKPKAFTTVLRWARHGYADTGIRLECLQQGRTICTTEAAVLRFFERLSTGNRDCTERTPSEQRVARDAARQFLDAVGI